MEKLKSLVFHISEHSLKRKKEVSVLVTQSCLTQRTHQLWVPMLPWNSPGKNTGVDCHFLLQGIYLGPGIKPRSPTLQADSLLTEPPEKSKNSGVGGLSLLQGNFPTQESNRGVLHCRQILYQLSYLGSPEQKLKVTCPASSIPGFTRKR